LIVITVMRMLAGLVLASVAACQGSVGSVDDAGLDAPVTTLPGDPCSTGDITGTLPGVTISIVSASCRYHRGQAASFEYEVVVDASVPAIDVPASQSCDCAFRSQEIASWVTWQIDGSAAGGENQRYCLCDTGCCPGQDATTVTPEVGTSADTIQWSGHVWNGPSDTGNQEGDPFAVGTYAVNVSFTGFNRGSVTASLPIEVIP
jgi:hypothetical protein